MQAKRKYTNWAFIEEVEPIDERPGKSSKTTHVSFTGEGLKTGTEDPGRMEHKTRAALDKIPPTIPIHLHQVLQFVICWRL